MEEAPIPESAYRRTFYNTLLTPYINAEALKTDWTKLPSLLRNRTLYTPSQWATYDCDLHKKEWAVGSFPATWNGNCIAMHGDRYGQLVDWNKKQVHDWNIMGFRRGLFVLLAQQRCYRFLREMTQNILEGVDLNNIPRLPEFPDETLSEEKGSMTEVPNIEPGSKFVNQAYSPPVGFDLQEIENIIWARANFHTDHL